MKHIQNKYNTEKQCYIINIREMVFSLTIPFLYNLIKKLNHLSNYFTAIFESGICGLTWEKGVVDRARNTILKNNIKKIQKQREEHEVVEKFITHRSSSCIQTLIKTLIGTLIAGTRPRWRFLSQGSVSHPQRGALFLIKNILFFIASIDHLSNC